ncbi:MAG: FliM/FliN family flagellar motor switch protein, partial [Planctomycetaceae bacterium]|nr:FliM/FliN family flagellar motor switch protein [Planctomycetaceae bacterium]
GGNHPSSISQRPLTEIEQRLALHLAGMVLAELRPIWSPEAAAELTVERIETNPHRLSECLPASEPIWQMEFTVAIEHARGGLRICLPASLAAQLCPLDAAGAATSAARPTGAAGNPLVQLVAHLAETTLTDRDLAELRPGDLITTDHTVESPLIIRVDGVPQFQARPGAMQGRKAVRIEDLLEPPG